MAEQEYRMLLSVDTGESVKTVGDLKNNVKFLKKALDETEAGTDEYNDALKELQLNQRAIKIAMKGSVTSMKEVERTANGVGDSYNALSAKMSILKQEHHATNDEFKRNEISASITDINDKLKDMDANNGVYSRNVGNYTNSITQALASMSGSVDVLDKGFGTMGISIGGLKAPLMGLNGMFTMLSANPFIAVAGALVLVIQQIAKWLKTSEDNMNAMRLALAPLTASTTAFKNIMQKLGEWLGKAVQWITDLAKKLHLFSDEMLASIEVEETLTEKEQNLDKKRRETDRKNADARLEISKLKAQSAEKDKYTAQERIKFIDEAIKKEEEVAKRNKELAEEEYRIQQGRAEQAGNSKEENDALAEAYVRVKDAEADYFNKKKELSAQRVEAINAIKAEQKAVKDLKEEYKPEKQEEEEVVDEIDVEAENEALKQHYITDAQWEGINARYDAQKQEEEAFAEHNAWMEEETKRSEEAKKKTRQEGLMTVASMTSDILGNIADIVGEENEKQFRVSKGLQIAQATINTIAGAVGAFTGITSSTGGWGIALAVAQATAVLTAGMAQVAKIKATKYDRGGAGTPSAGNIGASVNAPQVRQDTPMVRQLTGAKEEDAINRAREKPVRAYVVGSDIEADADMRRRQKEESSF